MDINRIYESSNDHWNAINIEKRHNFASQLFPLI